jgi:hypothetical protein
LFFINHYYLKRIFKLRKTFKNAIFAAFLATQFSSASAEESFELSERWRLLYGGVLKGNFRTAGENLQINHIPNQNLDNQASSSAAFNTDDISLRLGLDLKNTLSLHTRVDYNWQKKFHYDLYPKSYSEREFQLRDFYLNISLDNNGNSIWFGKRTFEFDNIYLFQESNPFNQIELQGMGFETKVFQVSFSVNKESVYTTAKDKNGNQINDSNGKASLYQNDDWVGTAFLSGKFLLSEGKIFQPIVSLRAYQSFPKSSSEGVNKDKVTISSSLIVGGIFSRPLSDGLKGTTTVWLASLPADKDAQPESTTIKSAYYGEGRIPPNYPQNTIGFADSSEYFINKYGGILTGIILLNNTYASELPLLHISDNGKYLESDGKSTSRTTNRISLGLQPVLYLPNSFQLGLDLNYNYVTKKLLLNDANSYVITPILKYSFDGELKTNKYIFMSASYGVYDWKIKTFSDGSQTDTLLTTQAGIQFVF